MRRSFWLLRARCRRGGNCALPVRVRSPTLEPVIKKYVAEAIAVEKAGLKVKLKAHSDYKIPEELEKKLKSTPKLKKAFDALTPGRQRGYMFHIAKPKQAKTREARVEQCIPLILEGKGLND